MINRRFGREITRDSSPAGANKRTKRVGRGPGSGHGKTSTQVIKGEVRSGGGVRPDSKAARCHYKGVYLNVVHNIFKKEYAIVNIQDLNIFDDGTEVTIELLQEAGMVKG